MDLRSAARWDSGAKRSGAAVDRRRRGWEPDDTGTLLICDFDTGFKAPEMVKKRPVVVISPRRRRSVAQLCTVVPLSTTAPDPVERFHHRMNPKSLPVLLRSQDTWAKCDMLYTVSLNRLDRVRVTTGGKRTYSAPQVLAEDLDAIRRGVITALKLDASCSPQP